MFSGRHRESLGEILSAYEFWDGSVKRFFKTIKGKLFSNEAMFYVLIETGGSDAEHDQDKMTRFLEKVMNDGFGV